MPVGPSPSDENNLADEPTSETEFQVGQIVALRSDPEKTGAVIAFTPSSPENRYSVFHDGNTATYYASQLCPVDTVKETPQTLALDEFHARLSAQQIRYPSRANLYSINAGRIDFVPYQYRPVLKFIRSDRPRLLIADGVGVGKTIEAILIMRELEARRDLTSVLVICPKPLVVERKWYRELQRFDERFTQLDGAAFRYCLEETDLEGEWPAEHSKTILPYSLFGEAVLFGESRRNRRGKKGLLGLDPPPRFDLVIVDEAHRIRNPETMVHQGVRFFCEHAEAVVFLTATPLQLEDHNLFVLLNTLRPDLVIDFQTFAHMAAPNQHINHAVGHIRAKGDNWQGKARQALVQAAATPWGRSILQNDPDFQEVCDTLERGPVPDKDRVASITALEQLHTFAGIINRTRRRDIGQFTIRRPETVTVDFTNEQRELHDAVLRVQARIFTEIRGHENVKFLMTTIRRQTASCLFGLAPLLTDILTRHIDDFWLAEADESFEGVEPEDVKTIEAEIVDVLQMAEGLSDDDPKLRALQKIIADKQQLPNNKVMVFSGFRHTLSYLFEQLQELRVGMVHGGTPDDERVVMSKRFRLDRNDPESLDVLLFSEVGCEGLDFEFCDCMINYDLPWNPMRIEQRIGRIDRRGQQSESVSIFNLITPGTVDAEIYNRCLWRIGVFNREVGGGEEILGEITREIRNIAEDVSLTAEEQQAKLQQLADNKIRLIQEQEELEARQMELFGLHVPDDQSAKEVENASSYWLSPESLQNLLSRYLATTLEGQQEHILGGTAQKTLRLSQEGRERLLADFRRLPRERSSAYKAWENWLKGPDQHLSITFEPACASGSADTILVNPLHPLVRQAAASFERKRPLFTACTVLDEKLPAGRHSFAIYHWHYRGLREDQVLQGVCDNDLVAENLLELIAEGQQTDSVARSTPDDATVAGLEDKHYKSWLSARESHRDRILRLAEFRRESLDTSHKARMSLLQEKLAKASEEKIQRMTKSQIETARADYDRRRRDIDEAVGRTDITFEVVAYGVLEIRRS